ncbi:unnamed protein product [Durusdinium trenchii]|uniref:Uncharacterized protein n=1 Tax=Durusdinium trenchii TaxID=1381693 RepID=A0ABP0JD51_9DINO
MVDPGTAVEGQEATRPENQRSMEEQLEALNQKLQHLAEQERALSRRMACRSPSAARGKTVGLEDLGRAKRRNESLEEFCDHWMAWLRAGNLREGADAETLHITEEDERSLNLAALAQKVAESSQLGVLPEQLMEPLRELRVAGGRATGAQRLAYGQELLPDGRRLDEIGGGWGWTTKCRVAGRLRPMAPWELQHEMEAIWEADQQEAQTSRMMRG